MQARPTTLWTRLVCRLQGEMPADTLEAYRRASLAVLDLLEQSERERLGAAAEGRTPWTLSHAKQAEFACTWNAFVLQTLGNAFLDADYRDDPATAGFVPPITADQVLRFYAPVEGWLTRAQQAHADPNYRLDVPIPAELPAWSEVEPCPNSHLHGMLDALRAVSEHAQAAVNALEKADGLTPEQEAQRGAIRGMFAAALSKGRYADQMHGANPTRDVHERVEEHVKGAIEQLFLVGQLAAMPQRAAGPKAPAPVSAPPAGAPQGVKVRLPGESGFDAWCLTDRGARRNYADDAKAREAVETMWKLDPDPARTLAIKAEIDAAYTRGDVTFATDRFGKPVGYFFCCPWGSVYTVVRPVTLGGVRLAPIQQFVFDVTAEGVNRGVPFRRQVKVGDFRPTTRFEYGDPDEEPDH